MIEFSYNGIKYKYENTILYVGNISYNPGYAFERTKHLDVNFLKYKYLRLFIDQYKSRWFDFPRVPLIDNNSFYIDLDLVEELRESRNIYTLLEG